MKTLQLQNDTWELSLVPEWGGRVSALRAEGLDIITPLVASTFDPVAWPKGGIYPLMPYSNRLRNARLSHFGFTHALPPHPAAEPHTLHGVAQTLPWKATAQDEAGITLECVYEGEHWPWPVRFNQRFRLEQSRLVVDLEVTNLGSSSMPGGLGLHPYFQRHEGMRVELNLTEIWEIDRDYLPTGVVHPSNQPISMNNDLQQEYALYGSGWDGRLKVDYQHGQLLLETQAPLNHFVAFAPKGASYFCLEPVSHVANAFNMPQSQRNKTGTQILKPNESLTARLTFIWNPH